MMRIARVWCLWLAWGVAITSGIAVFGGVLVGTLIALFSREVSALGAVIGTPLLLLAYVIVWLPPLALPIGVVAWLWLALARRLPWVEYLPSLLVGLTLASVFGALVAGAAVLGWHGNDPAAFIPPFLVTWTLLVVPRVAVKGLHPRALGLAKPPNPAFQPPPQDQRG